MLYLYMKFFQTPKFVVGKTTPYSFFRILLGCTINFESQNYTIITSQCKGPQYPPQACCQAFKEFACPFTDAINDEQSDCATTMFSYINLYGKYPPGLFALQCREGKEGLDCTDILAAKEKSRGQISATPSTLLLLLAAFFVLVYHLL